MTARWVAGALCGLLFGLAACTTPNATEAPAEVPVKGGTFRQGLVKVASLDPARAATVSERVLADELYDTLVVWDAVTSRPLPSIAARWTATAENKSWTFNLRPDAKATNGEAVTASDVKRTLEATIRPSTIVGDLLAPIVGYQQFANDPTVGEVVGITAPDPITVKIELSAPLAGLPSLLANPAFGIKHFPAGGEPVGTGPFVLESSDADKSNRLVRSPHGNAYLDAITTTFFPDVDSAYVAMEAGSLDWVPVSPAKATDAGRRYGSHLFRPSLRAVYLSINTQNPKFTDKRFREALIRAIDRPSVARLADGEADVIDSISTDAVPDAERTLCGTTCAYDAAASKATLATLFPAGPPPVVIDVVAGAPMTEAVRKKITDDLAAAGIAAELRSAPADQFGTVTVTAERQLLQTGWSAAYPSAEAFLPLLFQSRSAANVSGFSDPDIDRRFTEAQAQLDEGRRNAAFVALERDILNAVPVIPLMQFPVASVASPSVRGLAVRPTGNFDASTVWLAPAS